MTLFVKHQDFEDGPETRLWLRIYQSTSGRLPPANWYAPLSLKPYLQLLCRALGWPEPYCGQPPLATYELEDDSRMVVAFSGGKDSSVSALLAEAKGYEPVLYHVAGLNRAYPHERQAAERVADLLGYRLVVHTMGVGGKAAWKDVPSKNQCLMGWMAEWARYNGGIRHHTVGDMATDVLAVSQPDCNLSDAYELLEGAAHHLRITRPGYTYHHQLRHATDALAVLTMLGRWDVLEATMGCLAPTRFRDVYREANEKKYRLQLLPNRCGSCWKCCMEWLALERMGWTEPNEGMERHCIKYLRTVLPRERPWLRVRPTDEEMVWLFVSGHVVNEVRCLRGLPQLYCGQRPLPQGVPEVASFTSPLSALLAPGGTSTPERVPQADNGRYNGQCGPATYGEATGV